MGEVVGLDEVAVPSGEERSLASPEQPAPSRIDPDQVPVVIRDDQHVFGKLPQAVTLARAFDDLLLQGLAQASQPRFALPQRRLSIVLRDGMSERRRYVLEERRVRDAEIALVGTVDLQHAVAPLRRLDEHVEGTMDAVFEQELRRPEARLAGEVVRQHGLARLKGVAGRAFEVGAEADATDRAGVPAEAGRHRVGGRVLERELERPPRCPVW